MFASRLKKVRKDANLTLEELSNIYNKRYNGKISRGTLSKYENNKQEPLISVARNLSQILNVSVDYLLGNVTTPGINASELVTWYDNPLSENGKSFNIAESEKMSGLGNRIFIMRKQLGWTQEELANKMRYKSKSSINKIELGLNDIPQSRIVQFANVLGTTPAYLMGWEGTPAKELPEPIIDDVLFELLTDLSDLTEEERAKVSAFIQSLKANR
jgi:transcriptional regulator with XRE-family HTH domain